MKKKNERGFTIVELLIVMVVVGILAAIAIPNFQPLLKKDKLRATTTTVTSTLYLARMKAVNDGKPIGVKFDANGRFYVVTSPKTSADRFGVPYKLEEGVEIVSNTFNNGVVIFTERGQLDKSCLPTGTYTGEIVMTDGTVDSTRVEVTFISGRIRETNL